MIDIKDKLVPTREEVSPPQSKPRNAERHKKKRDPSSSDYILQDFGGTKRGITRENLNIAVEKTLAQFSTPRQTEKKMKEQSEKQLLEKAKNKQIFEFKKPSKPIDKKAKKVPVKSKKVDKVIKSSKKEIIANTPSDSSSSLQDTSSNKVKQEEESPIGNFDSKHEPIF